MLTEFEEQALFVEYLELLQAQGKIVIFSAVPNNTFTKSWKQKRKQTKEGVRPGVPDLIIVTTTEVIFMEFKRTKGGVLSIYQKEWIKALPHKQTEAVVVKGFEEAKQYIERRI